MPAKPAARKRVGASATKAVADHAPAPSRTKKKVVASPPKTTARKTAPKKSAQARTPPQREFDEHGFVVGTDSSKIMAVLVEGGLSRADMNKKIARVLKKPTRGGGEKNIPSLVAGILTRVKARGYKVEESWRLVPPARPKRRPAPGKRATGRVKTG